MAKIQLTVQEALNKKTVYDKRIKEALNSRNMFCIPMLKNATELDGVAKEELEATIKRDFQQLMALISNRETLAKEINKSNAITTITVCGKEYTCADAIAKSHRNPELLRYYSVIREKINQIADKVQGKNENTLDPDNIDQHIKQMISENTKISSDLVEKLRESYIENNTWILLDPAGVKEKINELIIEIEDFDAAVHTALTTSNINTVINVDFVD